MHKPDLCLMHIPHLYLIHIPIFIWCTYQIFICQCLYSRSLSDAHACLMQTADLYLIVIHTLIFTWYTYQFLICCSYQIFCLYIYIPWRNYLMHMPIAEQRQVFSLNMFLFRFCLHRIYCIMDKKKTSHVCLVLMRRNVLYNLYNMVIRLLFFAYKGSCDLFKF